MTEGGGWDWEGTYPSREPCGPMKPGDPPSDAELIGLGKLACPLCGKQPGQPGIGKVYLPARGKKTGFRVLREKQCLCFADAMFYRHWSGVEALAPPSHQWVRLRNLQPCPKLAMPVERQAGRIEFMQENPDLSYLFIGPAMGGKTVYSSALLQYSLADWAAESFQVGYPIVPFTIFRFTASSWLKKAVDFEMGRMVWTINEEGLRVQEPAPAPTPCPAHIRQWAQRGKKAHVFIEELDKAPSMTEFKISELFELFNAVSETGGQLVGTANQSLAFLDNKFGEEFTRRFLQEDQKGQIMSFFPEAH
jgi:hypothetical protein